jgi:hypothetical protein
MNNNEQFTKKIINKRFILLGYGNVIVPTQNKIQKGEFLLAFFYACRKNLQ